MGEVFWGRAIFSSESFGSSRVPRIRKDTSRKSLRVNPPTAPPRKFPSRPVPSIPDWTSPWRTPTATLRARMFTFPRQETSRRPLSSRLPSAMRYRYAPSPGGAEMRLPGSRNRLFPSTLKLPARERKRTGLPR